MQKFGEVKFSKDRVKIQIRGKPVIFSHELCLYITRFASRTRNASFRENAMFYVVTVNCNCNVSVYYRVT